MFEPTDVEESDNVVDLIKRRALVSLAPKIKEEDYTPSDSDIEAFLMVLDYIRGMSVSQTGSIQFNDEYLTVKIEHLVDTNTETDSTLSFVTKIHSDFVWDAIDSTNDDEILLSETAIDFWNALQELTQEPEDEENN